MTYKDYNVPRGTIEKYIELLKLWNKKINLVSYIDEEELINRHILDSLQLISFIRKEDVVFDLGSGAGFPGLMLSYAGVKEVHLVEKITKKASFLVSASSLSENKVIVHNNSIEDIRPEYCDIITSRALASLESIFDLSKNLAKKNTKYILLKGRNVEEELKKALEKWNFKYIIYPSKTSSDGSILEISQLIKNE